MSITMNTKAGRKGKQGPTSPTASIHSPPSATSSLPKIKLNIRSSTHQFNRPSSASSLSRPGSSSRRGGLFSEDSSSDLTPAEDDDDNDDDEDDDDETEDDDFPPQLLSRKAGKKRESLSNASPSVPTKGRPPKPSSSPVKRPSAHGPSGRDRKRAIKLGEVARRRARDDKFGFGGDRFGGATPTQSRIPKQSAVDSDSTSSYGDDESEREMTQSLADGDETEDEYMGGLHEAFAGHEIEDLAYGAGHPAETSLEDDAEMEWWNDNEDDDDDDDVNEIIGNVNVEEEDEEFIANLTGSDIDQLQSQSSVHASSDDPMSDSSSESDDALDEFGFPAPFASHEGPGDQPLVLMENWDGQFVLVQPRHSRRRERGSGSRTNGSVGESTTLSAGEQQLLIDDDANDDTDSSVDWSGVDDDDGGDTTDSMAEEDMPVLDSPALDEIIGQQMASGQFDLSMLPHPNPYIDALDANPSIVITDVNADTPLMSGSTSSTASSATPGLAADPGPMLPQLLPVTPVTSPPSGFPVTGPVMGTFTVSEEPCESAVIDGSKTTTKSPFTRRRRHKSSDSGSVTSKSRRRVGDPFSPAVKKTRYSSIPGHPRYIAARRAAASLMDPLDRESTPSDDENAFSLEDMLDPSMLPMNDMDSNSASPQSPELRHLFRFDKVPVSMYMRRNFSSASRNRTAPPTPSQESFSFASPVGRSPNVGGVGLSGTLAGPLSHPASRMLISPLLQPTEGEPIPLSRKERRRARKGLSTDMQPLQI